TQLHTISQHFTQRYKTSDNFTKLFTNFTTVHNFYTLLQQTLYTHCTTSHNSTKLYFLPKVRPTLRNIRQNFT
ncbi:MAG: hypothetical protein ACKPKO_19930, partial [Candidatus Fonsibacter sp.]